MFSPQTSQHNLVLPSSVDPSKDCEIVICVHCLCLQQQGMWGLSGLMMSFELFTALSLSFSIAGINQPFAMKQFSLCWHIFTLDFHNNPHKTAQVSLGSKYLHIWHDVFWPTNIHLFAHIISFCTVLLTTLALLTWVLWHAQPSTCKWWWIGFKNQTRWLGCQIGSKSTHAQFSNQVAIGGHNKTIWSFTEIQATKGIIAHSIHMSDLSCAWLWLSFGAVGSFVASLEKTYHPSIES